MASELAILVPAGTTIRSPVSQLVLINAAVVVFLTVLALPQIMRAFGSRRENTLPPWVGHGRPTATSSDIGAPGRLASPEAELGVAPGDCAPTGSRTDVLGFAGNTVTLLRGSCATVQVERPGKSGPGGRFVATIEVTRGRVVVMIRVGDPTLTLRAGRLQASGGRGIYRLRRDPDREASGLVVVSGVASLACPDGRLMRVRAGEGVRLDPAGMEGPSRAAALREDHAQVLDWKE